ncbi:MAG: FAD-binding oxidoreductase [Verrucomicrobia bacterium]|nr:FAD-binding oxidoreductase [Verrucomicrobiota bacterium]
MKHTADVVVIGAGVHGASTAFHLAKGGAGRVVLIDQYGVASGPTAKSGAMMRPIFTEAPYIQLVQESIGMMERWDEIVGGDAGYVGRGFLRFTVGFGAEELGGDLELMRRLGVNYEVVDAAGLRTRTPGADFVDTEQGLWIARSGYADPVKTTRALALAAVRHGAELREGERVTALLAEGSRITGVRTDRGEISTRLVVNCAGPWSARLAAAVGVELPIQAHSGGTTLFQRPLTLPEGGPILSDGVNQVYLRDVSESVVRAAHFGWTNHPVDPDDYDETISARHLSSLRTGLSQRYQGMRRAVFAGGFAAVYDMTPDGHPIIGPVGGVEGFWCNCGWSGNGFASAAAVGRHLTLRLAGQTTEVDLGMFAWPRPPTTTRRPDSAWIRR